MLDSGPCGTIGVCTFFVMDILQSTHRAPASLKTRLGDGPTGQVMLSTNDIEAGFEQNQRFCAAFVDIAAAHDNVWLRGLHPKLRRMLPDRHMVLFVMELFTVNK